MDISILYSNGISGLFYEALNRIHEVLNTPVALKSQLDDVQSTVINHWQIFDRVFVTTNELNADQVIASLKEKPIAGNTGIYTSGLFSLDLAAVERDCSQGDLENIIVLDRAPVVKEFWAAIEEIIKNNVYRDNAILKIKELITEHQEKFFPECSEHAAQGYLKSLEEEINAGTSFLSTDQQYKKIRDIFCKDRFTFIQLDLCDETKTKKLGELLKANSMTIDTLYVSNIYGLLFDDLERVINDINGGDYRFELSCAFEDRLSALEDLGLSEGRNDKRFRRTKHEEDFPTLYGDTSTYENALVEVKQKLDQSEEKLREFVQTTCNQAISIIANQQQQNSSDLGSLAGELFNLAYTTLRENTAQYEGYMHCHVRDMLHETSETISGKTSWSPSELRSLVEGTRHQALLKIPKEKQRYETRLDSTVKATYEDALAGVSQKVSQKERNLKRNAEIHRKNCNVFLSCMENILGNDTIKTHLVHASRKCENGCCRNPMRMDDSGSLKETLETKTPCTRPRLKTIDLSKANI